MKKPVQKILSLVLAATIAGSGVGASAIAAAAPSTEGIGSVGSHLTDSASSVAAAKKSETVYVIAGADGTVKKLIVSDRLTVSGEGKVEDKSNLSGIENVKGDEKYTANGADIVWDAEGKDIYYQGTTDQELPVTVKISYFLDGTPIAAEDLAGKSGQVTIRLDYENRTYRTVMIDGQEERIYVPFVMMSGLILDDDVFSDVTISSGKLVSDGDRTFAVGIAFPGLSENLALGEEGPEIPDHVEITAKVKGFRLAGTVTLATDELFSGIDSSLFDKTKALEEKLDAINDAMTQLKSGSAALYDGLCTLLDKSGELVSGIERLAAGAAALKEGSGDLKTGSADLAAGAGDLADGLHELEGHNDELTAGALSVFHTLLSTAQQQLTAAGVTLPADLTVDNYKTILTAVINSLDESAVREQATATALARVTAKVEENRSTITTQVTAAVRSEVAAQVTASVRETVLASVLETQGMTLEQYRTALAAGLVDEGTQNTINAAVDAQMATEAVQSRITTETDAQMESEAVRATIEEKTEEKIAALIAANMASEETTSAIDAAVAKAVAGAAKVTALLTGLEEYQTFYDGLLDYTDGVSDAADGADQVKEGADSVAEGAAALDAGVAELLDGIITMKDGTPALVSGITDLRDGAGTLRDGLVTFDEEAIGKITALVRDQVSGLLTRLRATIDVAADYTNFAGMADGTEGSVRFIYRTDDIKEKKEKNNG